GLNNSGTVVSQGGTLALNTYVNNTGTVVADGGTVTATSQGSRLDSGRWVARNGGTLALPSALAVSQASLTADGASSTITGLQGLAVNAGTLVVTSGASLGTSGDLDNRGTITVGPGSTLTVGGAFTQEAAGTLDVQLGGAPAGVQFGKLAVTNAANYG